MAGAPGTMDGNTLQSSPRQNKIGRLAMRSVAKSHPNISFRLASCSDRKAGLALDLSASCPPIRCSMGFITPIFFVHSTLYMWGVQEKARRSTAKWLIDYFFK
jgi:hypothetical protein